MAGPQPSITAVPFQEAIDYHRQKLNLPTWRWTDVWEGGHTSAFVVAGARDEALLTSFNAAIDKAISAGTGLDVFRKDFDRIVAETGWSYKGGRNWRSRVIWHTNVTQSRNAGRWAQIQRVKERRPWLRYVHTTLEHPRLEHKAWHNLVLHVDDAWWDTHFPANGWGCNCQVEAHSDASLRRLGLKPGTAPTIEMVPHRINTSAGPQTIHVPKGIDPGFAYNPGRAAFGGRTSGPPSDASRPLGPPASSSTPPAPPPARLPPVLPEAGPPPPGVASPSSPPSALPPPATRPQPILPPGERTADLPRLRPAEPPAAFTGAVPRTRSPAAWFDDLFGGPEAVLRDPLGAEVAVGRFLLDHIADRPDGRLRFLPLIKPTVEQPAEIWVGFDELPNGRVVLRRRYVRLFDLGRERPILVVTQWVGRVLQAWTAMTRDVRSLDVPHVRGGHLIFRDLDQIE